MHNIQVRVYLKVTPPPAPTVHRLAKYSDNFDDSDAKSTVGIH